MPGHFSAYIKYTLLTLAIVSGCHLNVMATHNRAGEITYRHVSGYTYEITITTYTRYDNSPNSQLPSNQADRPELEINFGDTIIDIIERTEFVQLATEIRRSRYVTTHEYDGPGIYTISVVDPNRNMDIINLGGASSDQVPFALQTILVISAFHDPNSSPVLNYPPIDNACVFRDFWHNPEAIDPDGDSLSYDLVVPFGGRGLPLTSIYSLPQVSTINQNGDLLWSVPTQMGEFNFAIQITEWRRSGGNWFMIGQVIRDLQVTVKNCDNENPVLMNVRDTCVVANSILNDTITASDPNLEQQVFLTAAGDPFVNNPNPATFSQIAFNAADARAVFNWNTKCLHVRKQPYQVYFKAKDNDDTVQLLDVESWRITVVGPAPANPQAVPSGNSISLSWDASICSEVVSYKIYRRFGSNPFIPGHCELGVPPSAGYTLIATQTGLNNTTYIDNNNGAGLVQGHDYCYRIVAVFPDGAESYTSVEVCAQLKLDVPIITNVTVLSTGDPGTDSIAWARPRTPDFDPNQYPPPYRYHVYRSAGISGTNLNHIGSTPLSADLNDTNFVDHAVNSTLANSYRVDLYSYDSLNLADSTLVGSTNVASSVFLTTTPDDNKVVLNWSHQVPWTNTSYTIFRKTPWGTTFDSLTTVTAMSYSDTGLINESEYCYYVKSFGFYSVPGLVMPIVNLSQQVCEIPEDLVPPCSPELTVNRDCELVENTLAWTNPNLSCADDVVRYNIYYKPTLDGKYELVATVLDAENISITHHNGESIAGCYYVTALDSFANESDPSPEVCVDNCPMYELPNVFTPDSDGMNDYFTPFPYKFVESVELTIFNRWGQPVFTTTDPDINWNGTHKDNGKPVSEGVYYYTCVVHEIRLQGVVAREIQGFLHLFRGRNETPTQVN